MATAEQYAQWIVSNADKKGTPEFETVAEAYKLSRSSDPNAKYKAKSAPVPVDPTEDMSGTDKFLAGAGKAFYDVGRGVKQLTGLSSQTEIDDAKSLDAPLMKSGAGVAGNVAGNVALFLPTALVPGANTLTGAAAVGGAMGATQPVASDDSRLINTIMGAGGGLAGQGAANAIGRAVRPVQSALPPPLAGLAGKADDLGIPLTVAQKTGSRPLAITESVLENLPFTADRQLASKATQRTAFNRAALSTIGENADLATPEVLSAAKTRIGQNFKDLSARNVVGLDDDFVNALNQVRDSVTDFSSSKISESVDKAMKLVAKGQISGKEYQKVRSSLGKQAQSAFNSDAELGQALKSIKSALDEAATKSISEADKEAWTVARQQWQALKVIEKAAAPTSADAVAGNISPAKLAQALNAIDKNFKFGKGQKDLGDIARIGQAFIKDQVPNSGTAQRQFYQQALENPMKLIPGAAGMGSVPIQALMQSGAGQNYLTRGLFPLTGPMALAGKVGQRGLASGIPASVLANRE